MTDTTTNMLLGTKAGGAPIEHSSKHSEEVYAALKSHELDGEVLNDRPAIRSTVREYLTWDYQGSLDDAAACGDLGMLEAAVDLLVHRGYDDPIIVGEAGDENDAHWVITHG